MKMFKITATIEVTTEAKDHEEATVIGTDCLDWSNANIVVEELEPELQAHYKKMKNDLT
tara:strand:- start:9593 stop:9769 length:177 start_codon:yes stop_codon:yes gene_type:complete